MLLDEMGVKDDTSVSSEIICLFNIENIQFSFPEFYNDHW